MHGFWRGRGVGERGIGGSGGATKPCLTCTLVEGATLGTMGDGAVKQGDGKP